MKHIDQIRTETLLNAILVQAEFNISEEEYNTFVFALGCEFLASIFGGSEARIMQFVTEQIFWSWWKKIFAHWESDLLEFLREHEIKCGRDFYYSEMTISAHDPITEASFNTLLKTTMKHVKI